MVDLVEHLMEREDYPPELRFIKRRLTRPDFSRCRKPRSSDRICPYYLDGFCRLHERCPRAHLQSFDVYHSLLQAVRPDRAQEAAVPQLEFDVRRPRDLAVFSLNRPLQAPPATLIDPTTSAVAPVLATDEGPVVKLPDRFSLEPSLQHL
ncbi:hypothetical protein BJV78DRAFT_552791 [Lactifluus subvellereus]|nr:hypothetical protein BJV78DRAFT_552791 [Lactifluus subvellereus]